MLAWFFWVLDSDGIYSLRESVIAIPEEAAT